MKKYFAVGLFLASCLLLPVSSYAQFTTVTATVKDPNGIPYAGAVLNAVLVPSTGGGYTLSGQPYSGRIGPVTLDASGSFTVNFGDVTLITPGSPQWQITIDSAAATIALPLGTGPQSFVYTSTGTTISGSSPVSLSTALNALAPALTNITIGSGTVTSVSATSPVVVTPSPIVSTGTISCATCVVASSPGVGIAHFAGATQTVTSSAVNLAGADVTGQLPIGKVGSAGLSGTSPITISAAGTIACATCSTSSSTVPINQVVSATGAITPIALGSNTMEFDCATPSPTYCEIFGETSPSTSGRIMQITTLNGSAAQSLSINPGAAGPAGAVAPTVFGITGQTGGPAGASQNGFGGSGIFIRTGDGSAGGATTGTGGVGGNYDIGGGNGGAAGGSSANAGGNGGVMNWGIGNGGNGNTTGNGGNAGSFNINPSAGTGGNGGATSGTGGAGGDINFTSGSGGTAAVGSTTGRGGNITLTLAPAGGTGTPGVPGKTLITRSTGPQGSTTTPLLDLVDTWNTTGVIDALIRVNVTDTASGTGSLLMDLQHAGTSEFKLDKVGNGTFAGTVSANGVLLYPGARSVASNTAVGIGALAANGSGTDTNEVAIGNGALTAETGSAGGGSTVAIGENSCHSQNGSTGSNTCIGQNSMNALTTGNGNVGVGSSACSNLTSTNNNTCIGTSTTLSAATDTNEIVIGRATVGAGSATATIGPSALTDVFFGSSTPNAIAHAKSYSTGTNCSSSASPAVCSSASAGSVALPTNAVSSSIVVNTTAVTANSQIFVQTDDTLGTKLSVTCNSTVATLVGGLTISARTAGTSFTIANNVAVVTNPLCVSYFIVN